jgi:hypothetical protein
VFFGQGLEFLPQAFQVPAALLQGLTLGGQVGLGGIAGPAALAETQLQLPLAGLQGGAAFPLGRLLLFPAGPLLHQGVDRLGEAPLLLG